MKKLKRALFVFSAALPVLLPGAALVALPSCEGGAEEVGEDIDEAVEETGDAVEDATDGK